MLASAEPVTGLLADCARAGGWLSAMYERACALPVPPRSVLHLALGAAICDRLAGAIEPSALARACAARLRARLEQEAPAAWSGTDGVALAVAHALAPAEARGERARVALRALGAALPSDGRPVTANDALCERVLHGSAQSVAVLCDRIDALGIRGAAARDDVRCAGAALSARAFAAFRTPAGFELGARLLRVLASRALDPIGVAEGLHLLRTQQRVDGAFGDLPPRSPQAGDITFAFHLPRTVASLWAIHDALEPVSLLRLAASPARA